MAKETKFSARDNPEELAKLDKVLKTLGYGSRSEWYRECKRKLFAEINKD